MFAYQPIMPPPRPPMPARHVQQFGAVALAMHDGGRRNLSPDAFKLLLGRRYNRVKKAEGAPVGNKRAEKQPPQIGEVVSAQCHAKKPVSTPVTVASTMSPTDGYQRRTTSGESTGSSGMITVGASSDLGDRRRFNADGGPKPDGAIPQ